MPTSDIATWEATVPAFGEEMCGATLRMGTVYGTVPGFVLVAFMDGARTELAALTRSGGIVRLWRAEVWDGAGRAMTWINVETGEQQTV